MFDIVSQVALGSPQASPAASIDSSAAIEQDFSSLLLQLVGNSNLPIPQAVAGTNPFKATGENILVVPEETSTPALQHPGENSVKTPPPAETILEVVKKLEIPVLSKSPANAVLEQVKKLATAVLPESPQPTEPKPIEVPKQPVVAADLIADEPEQLPVPGLTLPTELADARQSADRNKLETPSEVSTQTLLPSIVTILTAAAATSQQIEQPLPSRQANEGAVRTDLQVGTAIEGKGVKDDRAPGEALKVPVEAILAEVKKFVVTVEAEPVQPIEPQVQPKPAEQSKQEMISTAPLANFEQLQFEVRRITPQPSFVADGGKAADLTKAEPETTKLPETKMPGVVTRVTNADPQQIAEQPLQIPQAEVPKHEVGVALNPSDLKTELKAPPVAQAPEVNKPEVALRPGPRQPEASQPVELLKQAMVTTDPIANIRQSELPLRMITVQRSFVDAVKTAGRTKAESATALADSRVLSSTGSSADTTGQVQSVDQAVPAQQIEIPQLPKLQVVRTVSVELGDPGSQVTVRIEDRSGGMKVHVGTGNEALHRSLETSVESLVHALKQERIDVSNVEVFRKSPIDKVRRMKEAH